MCLQLGASVWAGLGVSETEWRGLIGLIEEQWAMGKYRVASRTLRLLPRYAHSNPESVGPITALLTRLAQTEELGRTANKVARSSSSIARNDLVNGLSHGLQVYEGLMADNPNANDLLRVFAAAHNSVLAAQAQQQPLNPFLRLKGREEPGEGDDGEEDDLEDHIWSDLYEIVVAGRKHVLSYILELVRFPII